MAECDSVLAADAGPYLCRIGRTEMILAKQQRGQPANQMSRDSCLRSLEIGIRFAKIRDSRHQRFGRAAELINKTNQFNTTGKRWSGANPRIRLCTDVFHSPARSID
jgi:hypothetical protein